VPASRRDRLYLRWFLASGLLLAVWWHPATRGPWAQEAAPETSGVSTSPAGAANGSAPDNRGRKIPREPLEVLIALGLFVYPLGLCSLIVVWFSIERVVVLRRGRVIPKPFVKRFFEHIEQGKVDAKGAIKLCEDSGSPIAHIFLHGLKKWGRASVEIEQAIIDGGERQLNHLRKHIRVLNGTSTVAPLLGLLGTVVGMIDSFNAIATSKAMGKGDELAAGIGLSLLTTAVGLLIAIPALIMYMYFAGRVDSLVHEMDGYGQDLVELISAEGLAEQARQGRTPLMAAAKK
jgi:biopolymer transport protein ExbB